MTLVVATALGDTPDELLSRAMAAAEVADLVEVRLDGPSGLPWDLRPYFQLAKPAIATVRVADEGGRSNADDEARAELLRRALRAGAAWIDVEAWHANARALVRDAHELGGRVIVSAHDLQGTPDAEAILKTMRDARALGADIVKLATRVNAPEDALALVEAAARAQREGIPCALMAVNDPFLRLLAPQLGLALAYGRVPDAPAAASGQVDARALREAHRMLSPGISARTRVAFVLGHPIAHSKSPAMQSAAFRAAGIDAVMVALDVEDPAAVASTLRASLGASVTTPLKESMTRAMDALAPSAVETGTINCVQVVDGTLVGHNTDGAGAVDALREARVKLDGARVLVLGAGGTARAVVPALRSAGALVRVANRTREHALALDEQPIAWGDVPAMLLRTDVLVNLTTIGMLDDAMPVPAEKLPARGGGLVVMDAVYKPGGSRLLREARARGLRTIAGEAMLLHQGAAAFRIWTGKDAPLDAMRGALE